jgi:hypothetical protein
MVMEGKREDQVPAPGSGGEGNVGSGVKHELMVAASAITQGDDSELPRSVKDLFRADEPDGCIKVE